MIKKFSTNSEHMICRLGKTGYNLCFVLSIQQNQCSYTTIKSCYITAVYFLYSGSLFLKALVVKHLVNTFQKISMVSKGESDAKNINLRKEVRKFSRQIKRNSNDAVPTFGNFEGAFRVDARIMHC